MLPGSPAAPRRPPPPPAASQRRELPIFQARGPLLSQLRGLECAVLIGETGSGKTTQIPQYLYEAGIGRQGIIAVTQPRRVAAISLATRVSDEKRTELGKLVGYTVRFDDLTSDETRIKFLTDGMLLREAIGDPILRKYSVVILDEAHERTIHTDVLFGVVKAAQKKRKELGKLPLKVIVMSATMDVDQFSQYFNGAPVLYLEGRQHPIQVFYTKQPQSDYLQAALVSVFQIHQEAPSSQDILVFLTGQEEIEAMTKTCRDIAKHLPDGCPQMTVMPLYASLPYSQQLRVFQAAPKGCRKVILSTNIAETSITISGIKYVVDTGMVKAKKYNPEIGLEVLAVQRVSKAQAWQRTGRAGREDSGICYRLYTEDEFEKFDKMTVPEIQRCNLASVLLQLLALRIPNILTFDFMSKPSPDAIQAAIEQLDLLGAVEQKEDQLVLTPLGRKMAAFPLEPKFSKTILLSPKFHCTEEILTIVSLLSVDSVLYNPPARRDEVQSVRKKFISSEGDHLTLLNVYRAFKNVSGNKVGCSQDSRVCGGEEFWLTAVTSASFAVDAVCILLKHLGSRNGRCRGRAALLPPPPPLPFEASGRPPPKVTLGVGLEPAPQRGGRSAGSAPSTSGSAACPRLAMLLARALRAAAALRPALPPRRPLSSLPPRALLPPPPLARSLWQRSDGGGWRGALLRPRRGSAGGVSCGCGGLHTEGDKAFAQFLTDEIKEERKIQKHKALPKVSGGWELEVHGTEARLVRKVAGEKITVTFNINNSIPPAVDDEAPEEQKPDEQEEPDITSTPNFIVEVIKDDTKQTLVLDCHYPEDEVGHEGEEESDIFTIREVSFQPTGESDWKDTNYTLNTDSLDWALYDHLMDFLADRGVDNTFADELIELSTALEHQEYIKFLEDLKSFVKCQ